MLLKYSKYMNYIITFRFIKLISYICAKHIQTERKESHKHRYKYYYSLQFIYGTINQFLLISVTGLLLNILPQIIITTISFISLRLFSGGLHFDNYKICTYFTLLSFTVFGLLAKYIILNHLIITIIYLSIYFIIFIYAPVEHPNRPLNNNEKTRFKYIALLILTGLYLTTNLTSNIIITNSITFGILLAGLITLPVVNKLNN